GRTREVEHAMKSELERLSEAMLFEEAAKVRDQLRILEDFASKQKVVTEEEVDRDIFALAHEEDDACGIVFKVRDGKLVGKQHFFFTNIEGKPDTEILSALIERYYSAADYIPEEIVLPLEL